MELLLEEKNHQRCTMITGSQLDLSAAAHST